MRRSRYSVVAAVVVAVAVSGCAGASRHGRAAPSLQSDVSQAVAGLLVPTSGLQFATAEVAISNFTTAVEMKATDACLRADGFPGLPSEPGPGLSGTQQLPNLSYIQATHGFASGSSVRGVLDPTAGMSSAEKRAYNKAVTSCAPKLPQWAFDTPTANAMFSNWLNASINLIKTSPAVKAANLRGARCSASTAFTAPSYEKEQLLVTRAVVQYVQRKEPSLAREAQARGAGVFVRCFGAAVRTVDSLLAARSKGFLARKAPELLLIEHETYKQVAAVSAKYDIGFMPKRRSTHS